MKKIIYIILMLIFISKNYLFAGDYSKSLLSFNVYWSYIDIIWGDLKTAEHNTYSESTYPYAYGSDNYGIFADINPFKKNLSDNSFFLFGLRVIYARNLYEQYIRLVDPVSGRKVWGGEYLKYQILGIGPVISYIYASSQKEIGCLSFLSTSIDLFALGGPIFSGKLNSRAAAADYDKNLQGPKTTFDGYKISGGIGGATHGSIFGTGINIGMNIYYSKNFITTKEVVYPNNGRKISFEERTWDFYIGFHI